MIKIIRIETHERCNASCSICPVGAGTLKRELGRMSTEFFFKVVDQARAMGYEIESIGANEPLMEPRIFEFFDYIENTGGKQIIYTNASLLTRDMALKLSRYQYLAFTFSFPGGNKETYERIMGLDFEKAVSNIKYMISLGKISDFAISMQVCDESRDSISDFKNLWRGYKYKISESIDWINLFGGGIIHKKCNFLQIPNIFWDGRVAFCCMDIEGKVIIGDLRRQSLKGIIKGKIYQKYLHFNRKYKLSQLYPCSICRRI